MIKRGDPSNFKYSYRKTTPLSRQNRILTRQSNPMHRQSSNNYRQNITLPRQNNPLYRQGTNFPKRENPLIKKSNTISKSTKNLLIMVSAIILFIIIFLVIMGIIKGGSGGSSLDKFTADLKISEVQIINYTHISVAVEKGDSGEKFDSVNFIIYDDDNYEILLRKVSVDELEENDFNVVLRIVNTTRISAVSIAPVFISSSGNKILGKVEDEYRISPNLQESEQE